MDTSGSSFEGTVAYSQVQVLQDSKSTYSNPSIFFIEFSTLYKNNKDENPIKILTERRTLTCERTFINTIVNNFAECF